MAEFDDITQKAKLAIRSLIDICEFNYANSPVISKHVKMLNEDLGMIDEMDMDDIKKMINHAYSLCLHVKHLEDSMSYRAWNQTLYHELCTIDVKIFDCGLSIKRYYWKCKHDQRMDNFKKLAEILKEEPQ